MTLGCAVLDLTRWLEGLPLGLSSVSRCRGLWPARAILGRCGSDHLSAKLAGGSERGKDAELGRDGGLGRGSLDLEQVLHLLSEPRVPSADRGPSLGPGSPGPRSSARITGLGLSTSAFCWLKSPAGEAPQEPHPLRTPRFSAGHLTGRLSCTQSSQGLSPDLEPPLPTWPSHLQVDLTFRRLCFSPAWPRLPLPLPGLFPRPGPDPCTLSTRRPHHVPGIPGLGSVSSDRMTMAARVFFLTLPLTPTPYSRLGSPRGLSNPRPSSAQDLLSPRLSLGVKATVLPRPSRNPGPLRPCSNPGPHPGASVPAFPSAQRPSTPALCSLPGLHSRVSK